MAQTARPLDSEPSAALPPASRVVAFDEAAVVGGESPVLGLHQQLVASFAYPEPEVQKLPLRTRALVVSGAVMAPWLVIAAGFALFG